jgi:chromosome segregation ATPase
MTEERLPAGPGPETADELRIELVKSQEYQAILEQDRDHWKWSHALLGYTLISERERWRERDEAKMRWAERLQTDAASASAEVARLEGELREREVELGRQRVAYDEQADRLARLEGELREREAELGRQRVAYDEQADRLARLEGELASVKRHWTYRMRGHWLYKLCERLKNLGSRSV